MHARARRFNARQRGKTGKEDVGLERVPFGEHQPREQAALPRLEGESQRPHVDLALAGFRFAHAHDVLGGAERLHGAEDSGRALPFRHDAVVRAAHQRHGGGKAVVHRAHAEDGQIFRQRLAHGLFDAASPHGRGEAEVQHLVFARPTHRQR